MHTPERMIKQYRQELIDYFSWTYVDHKISRITNTDLIEKSYEPNCIYDLLSETEVISPGNIPTYLHTARRIEMDSLKIYNVLPEKIW